MSNKVYSLKRATPKMKIVHMRYVVDFKERLQEQQAKEAARKHHEEVMETCQQIRDRMTQEEYNSWWASAPEESFLACAREKLAELNRSEQETTAQECERIQEWISDHWDSIPEVEF